MNPFRNKMELMKQKIKINQIKTGFKSYSKVLVTSFLFYYICKRKII